MPDSSAWRAMVASLLLLACGSVGAALISPGTPTNSVPGTLFDPLSTLASPLPADEFLLPVEITGANGLQDWSYDLLFDASVVSPLDVGGLYQSVYQAEFSAADPTVSNITSSGFPGSLDGIAGFSSGVSGNGLLNFVLFQYLPGQQTNDPGFSVDNVTIVQQAPEPGTIFLLSVAWLGLFLIRLHRGRSFVAVR